jgi:hypothetical protein
MTHEVFEQHNSLAIILPTVNSGDSIQFSVATANSGTQLNCLLQLTTSELDSILILAAGDPRYIPSGRPHRKHRFLYCCMLIHCRRDVFTAPLHYNARGGDHRKHRTSRVARVRFRGNVFSEPLPSNELFRLSGVMSQYIQDILPKMLHFLF